MCAEISRHHSIGTKRVLVAQTVWHRFTHTIYEFYFYLDLTIRLILRHSAIGTILNCPLSFFDALRLQLIYCIFSIVVDSKTKISEVSLNHFIPARMKYYDQKSKVFVSR